MPKEHKVRLTKEHRVHKEQVVTQVILVFKVHKVRLAPKEHRGQPATQVQLVLKEHKEQILKERRAHKEQVVTQVQLVLLALPVLPVIRASKVHKVLKGTRVPRVHKVHKEQIHKELKVPKEVLVLVVTQVQLVLKVMAAMVEHKVLKEQPATQVP